MPVSAQDLAAASQNFGFLAPTDRLLAEIAALAEHVFHDDPRGCLSKLRLFGEGLARRIAAMSRAGLVEREQQLDLLRRLEDQGALPREAAQLLHHLRTVGNRATHELDAQLSHGDALHGLKVAREAALWFQRSYVDRAFRAGPFVPPPDPAHATAALHAELESLRAELTASRSAAENERARAAEIERAHRSAAEQAKESAEEAAFWERIARELEDEKLAAEAQLEQLKEQLVHSAEPTPAERSEQATRAEQAARDIHLDEATTRKLIDEQLRAAGWEANSDSLRYGRGARPARHRNLAIAEWPTESGPVDYALFLGLDLVAMIEAKRAQTDIPDVLTQAKRYSRSVRVLGEERLVQGTDREPESHRVPFLFATNGRPFLRQILSKSGIWMLDTRRSQNLSKPLPAFYTPSGLRRLLEADEDKALAALRQDPIDKLELRGYQKAAISAIEKELEQGRREILVAMATGTGKTRTSHALIYRLLSARRFRRILFLVDRTALGTQALEAANQDPLDGPLSLGKAFNIKGLQDQFPEDDTRLHYATVQGLVQRVLYPPSGQPPPIDQYDCIVVDECHRGYTLDRELSDGQLGFRDESDYISKYRRVLDHFDAVKIGLTATPALHTVEIFGNPAFTYSYRAAVVDGVLVDHEPPLRLLSALTQDGIHYAAGEEVAVYQSATQKVDTMQLPDELDFDVDDFNRRVINQNTTRVLCDELAAHLDPALPGKTLVFCVNDEHASRVVIELKRALAARYPDVTDDTVEKITGSADRPDLLLRRFRNEREPAVAVTVDLLTTGIDVPPIVNLVFLRRVRSRILYEQMLGRATRTCSDINKDCFRIFDAVELYDAMQKFTGMKPVAQRPMTSFAQLQRELGAPLSAETLAEIRDELIAKLRRKLRRLPEAARAEIELAAGMPALDLPAALSQLAPAALSAWLAQHARLVTLLDQVRAGGGAVVLSGHADQVVAVERGYGKAGNSRPEDYLDAFGRYLRDHMNELPALLVITQRPRELTRQALRELQLKLAEDGYTEAQLRTAWRVSKNQDIVASILGHIRQQALGEPLVPYEERVKRAVQRVLSRGHFTDIQKQWLQRIAKKLEIECLVDRASLDEGQFQVYGGWKRLNTVFDGKLEHVLGDLQEAVWQDAG